MTTVWAVRRWTLVLVLAGALLVTPSQTFMGNWPAAGVGSASSLTIELPTHAVYQFESILVNIRAEGRAPKEVILEAGQSDQWTRIARVKMRPTASAVVRVTFRRAGVTELRARDSDGTLSGPRTIRVRAFGRIVDSGLSRDPRTEPIASPNGRASSPPPRASADCSNRGRGEPRRGSVDRGVSAIADRQRLRVHGTLHSGSARGVSGPSDLSPRP